MSDFFKELNIIDILGIGVPGCLLVLLLGGDQTAALLWMDQFQNNALAFAIMLITAGSLAGMLIQELGDLIEKGLWLIPCLDPKVYAAHAVNTKDLDGKMSELENHEYAQSDDGAVNWIMALSVLGALAVVACASALLPVAFWRAAVVTDDAVWFEAPALWGLLPLAVTAAAVLFLRPALPKLTDAAGKNIKTIRNANPYIQTCLVGHGNTSKRTLFDGWRFVMRNLILVLAVTNLVSLWKPLDLYRQIADMMVGDRGDMTWNLFVLTLTASSVISLMLVRYYHYAYLRYKYSLENFMRLDDEKTEDKEKEAAK